MTKKGDVVRFFAGVGTVVSTHRNGKMLLVKGNRPEPYYVKTRNAERLVTA